MPERAVVLVVDDDDAIREFVKSALEDDGYEVEAAADGAEALARVRARMPQLILLDMRMPKMNGWEFAAEYERLAGPRAPVVVVTAGRDASEKAREIKAHGYIGKPFDLYELLELVARFAEKAPRP